MLKFANWILKFFSIKLIAVRVADDVVASARLIVSQTANLEGSGEFKRGQALRALMNRHPEASEHSLALAIELVLD